MLGQMSTNKQICCIKGFSKRIWCSEVEISNAQQPINLYDWDNIHYVVLACILIHNMMVEVQLENDEMDYGSLYKTINVILEDEGRCGVNSIFENGSLDNENVKNGTGTRDGSAPCNIVNHHYKFELVYKRWEALNDFDRATKLQSAMMRHLYHKKYGDEALNSAHKLV